MTGQKHEIHDAKKRFNSFILFVVLALFLSLIFAPSVFAATAKTISTTATGGACTTIGTWDAATKTCTLTADVLAGANNGIDIAGDGITLDGNGHTVSGTGTNTTGVSIQIRNNVTVKNLTISGFRNGVYLVFSNNTKVYNNNLLTTTVPMTVSGGTGNVFNQPAPTGGNWYSNFTTPAQGCVDTNGDHFCDAAYVFSGGSDTKAWITQSGWLVPPAPDTTPPAISSVAPSGIINTGTTNIIVNYSDTESNVNTASVSVALDGTVLTGCAVTQTSANCPVSGLTIGAHTISGSVSDNSANAASISGGFTVADSAAPVVTNLLPSGAINSTATTISANYSDDLSGINTASVSVTLDTAPVSGCVVGASSVSCSVSGLAEGGHSVAVSVNDNAANHGSASGSFTVDAIAPTLNNLQPTGTISNSAPTVSADYADTGSGVNTATATLSVDGSPALTGCSVTPTRISCPTSGLVAGAHSINAYVADNAGNTATTSGSFTVVAPDTTPPAISNVTPAGWIKITNPSIEADLADSGTGVNTASVAVRLDGGTAIAGCTVTATHVSCPTSALASGSHMASISAADNAGNSGSGTASFSVDVSSPVISNIQPTGTVNISMPTLSAGFSDTGSGINSATASVTLDGAAVSGCTATVTGVNCPTSGVVDGIHNINVSVDDNAGNHSTAAGTFTIDTTISLVKTTGTNNITTSSTGGACTSIGTWNATTKTCTLTTDLIINAGVNGIAVNNDGITIDGNGHTMTSSGGTNTTGVALTVRNNIVVKNLTIKSFRFGVYLMSSNNNSIYNNNFDNNTTQISASGSGNSFSLAAPTGGSWYSNYSTPTQGCNDINGDHFCDAPYVFSGGSDAFAWTGSSGWILPPTPDVTPPAVTSVTPSGVISTNAATIAVSYSDTESNVKVSTVSVTLDGSVLSGCAITQTGASCPVTGLAMGAHTIGGSVADNAGNPATVISGGFTVVDSGAPVVSGLLPSGSINTGSATLSASYSDSLSGINTGSVAVTLDGVAVSTCTATASGVSCPVTGLAQGNHSFTVGVDDNSANHGTGTGTFSVDTVAPAVSNILPTGVINVASTTVSADYADTGSGVNASTVTVRIDGGAPLAGCTASALHVSCTASGLAAGTHTIAVSVSDNAGNAGTGNGSFQVVAPDLAPPVASNIKPSGWINITNPVIEADLSDLNSGVNSASAAIKLDGVAMTGCTATAAHISCSATGLASGNHAIAVTVNDNAGNPGSGSGSFAIDVAAPNVSNIVPTGTINTASTTISASLDDVGSGINTGSASVTLDGAVVSGCTVTATSISCPVSGLSNAAHIAVIGIDDAAGNHSTGSNTFIVDTTIVPVITTGTNNITNNATGGSCTLIGNWDNTTLTCTLTTDLIIQTGKNGISINSNGITIDGNGHKMTGSGGTTTGVAISVKNNTTVKNLTVQGFGYGLYLMAANYNKAYNNNFLANTTQVSGSGTGNTFSQPVPAGGNFWSNYNTPAQGCNDVNADHFCDAPYAFSGGSDALPWTYQSGWGGSDPTPPSVTGVTPTGIINTSSAAVYVYYNDGGSGIRQSSVSVTLDGTALACTTSATQASCTATGLTAGAHVIGGSVSDNAGNASSISGGFSVVDNTGPAVSNILPSGTIGTTATTISAGYSDDISGINAASVAVTLDGAAVSGCTANATGVSCPVSGLTNSVHNIGVSATDNAGNVGTGSGSFTVNSDTTAPAVSSIQPTGWIKTGSASIAAYYSDTQSGVNAATVSVTLDGTAVSGCTITTSTVNCSASGLADGSHSIVVSVADNAGNTGSGSASFSVDTVAPVVSGIAPSGAVNSSALTITANFSDAGSGVDSASATVALDGTNLSGCTFTAASASCSTYGLASGGHTIMVRVNDLAGNQGASSASLTVDTAAPAISNILPSGIVATSSVILRADYLDSGSGIHTASVSLAMDGVAVSGCVVGPNNVTCPATVANGAHTISVSATDNAGNTGTGTGSFTVDTNAPTVSNVQPSGLIATTSTTVSASYADTGSGINSASAQVYMDSGLLSGCTATATGISCPVTGLAQGHHTMTVSVKNLAGNTGSATGAFDVDSAAPAVSSVLPTGTITTTSASISAYYSDATSGINTASVSVSLDGTAMVGCTVTASTASCPATGLAQGAHTISVSAADNAGNAGTGSGSFTVDSLAPSVTGLAPSGTIASASPAISASYADTGSGINSASARVYMDSGLLSGCTVTATGVSCPTTALAQGTHNYTVSVADSAGNTGSASGSFTVDTLAPAVSLIQPGGIINTTSASVSAYYSDATSGINTASVSVSLDGIAMTGCTVTASTASCPATGLANGLHNISVSATDNAGNTGTGTGSFTVDTNAPTVSNVQPSGLIATTSATVSASYADTGSGINSASAQVYMDSGLLSGCTATATGISCPVTGLAEGHHTMTVSVKNLAGNTGSATGAFDVDSAAPAVSSVLPTGTITTTSASISAYYADATSGINTASVSVSLDSIAMTGCTVSASTASCPATGLAQGAHTISVSAADNAGNAGTGSGSFTVDSIGPAVSSILPSGTLTTTSASISAYYADTGSGINTASASVSLDGTAMTGCTVTASTASCPATGLTQGAHTINVGVSDNAGNAGNGSGSFTVDSAAPAVTNILPSGTINTTSASVSAYYSDATSGIDTASVSVKLDGTAMTGCTVSASNASCPATGLTQGAHTISVSTADNAGNAGSGSGSFTVDSVGPVVSSILPSGTITTTSASISAYYSDATSGINTASVSVSLDGTAMVGCTVSASTASCPATGLTQGAHTINVSAADNAANAGTGSGSFTVDSVGPTVTGITPTGTVNNAAQTVYANYSDATSGINTASVSVKLDGTAMTGCTVGASGVSCATTGLAQGAHTISVSVADNAGNAGSGSGSFTVDSVGPVVSSILPSGTINTTSASISAYYSDATSGINTASVTVSLDGTAMTGCTVTASTASCPATGLAQGAHTISVSATDNAGNAGSGSGSFTVDSIAPAVSSILPSGTITTSSASVSAYYSDAGSGINSATAAVTLDGTAMTGCTVTASNVSCPATGLANGVHNIGVSVADNAGNTGTGSGSFTVAVQTDTTAPAVTNILPAGTITTTSASVSAYYSDAESGINTASVAVTLDGTAQSGCTVTASTVSCPATGLAQGAHTISVSAADNAGNAGSGSGSFTVDSVGPAVSSIMPTGTITTTSASVSAYYSDATSGINTASVSVSLDGTAMTGCTVSASTASCPATGLAQGAHTISVSASDNAGNAGTGSGSFTVDSVGPTVTGITPTGTVNNAAQTVYANYSDATSGINTASVSVKLDGAAMTGCTVGASGVSCATTGLAQGAHTINVSVADNAGNAGSGSGSFTVDSIAPAVSSILPTGTITTTSASISAYYSDATSGINTASVSVSLDGTAMVGCTVSASTASCPATGLTQGAHTISVSAADNAGNAGSGSGSFTVDSIAPAVSSILPSGTIKTTSASISAYYSDATSGINTASVSVKLDGAAMTGCTVTASTASCPATGLAQGAHTISVSASDNAANAGTGSGSFTVDSVGPTVTGITPTGTVNNAAQTVYANYSDATSGINTASVSVKLDGAAMTGCTVGASGVSCATTGLAQGAHTISVSAADNAGNAGSGSGSFTVDSIAPAVSSILPSGTIKTTSASISAYYSDATSGINTASVSVSLDGTAMTGCTVSASTASCPATGLAQGAHTISVSASDNAGNAGTGSGSFTVDSVGPTVTGITPTGTVNSAAQTVYANYSDATSGINTASVSVSLDGTAMTGCTVGASGVSCAATGLAEGAHTISVSTADNAGNAGTGSGSFTIDSIAPAVSSILPTGTITTTSASVSAYYSDATSGINTASVSVSLDGTAMVGCTVSASTASCLATGLAQGAHTISVSASDNAGNAGTGSGSFTVDSVGPTVTGITPTGTVNSAAQTVYANYSDATSGINTASVSVSLDGTAMTGCTVGASGVSCAATGLAQGAHTISVSAADNAGNAGTGTGSFTVDSAAPAVTNILPSGTIKTTSASISAYYSDATSGINTASVAVTLDGTAVAGCVTTSSSVSCPVTGLAQGSHVISVRADDVAGNTATGSGSFTVDSVAPAVTNILPTGSITTTSATVSAYYSDATSGINTASVSVTLDGTAMTGCTVSASTVSCAATGLANGAHTINVSVADNAGNTGTGTGSFSVTPADTTPPSVTNIAPTGTITTTSASVSAYYSDAGSGINTASVAVTLDGTAMSGCTIGASTVTCPATGLAQGAHNINVSVSDVAGNAGSGTGSFTVDSVAPAVTNIAPTGTITTTSATVSAYYSDAGTGINTASVAVTLDGTAMSGCTVGATTVSCPATGLTSGSHAINVSVLDIAGNTGTATGSFTVSLPSTGCSYTDADGATIGIYSDAGYTNGVCQGDTLTANTDYYMQVTSPTANLSGNGTNTNHLRLYSTASSPAQVSFGDGTNSKPFTQSTTTAPYTYRVTFRTPATADIYNVYARVQDNSSNQVRTMYAGMIVGSGAYVRTYSDAAYSVPATNFGPSDTVYVQVYDPTYTSTSIGTGTYAVPYTFGYTAGTNITASSVSRPSASTYRMAFAMPGTSGDKVLRMYLRNSSNTNFGQVGTIVHIGTAVDTTAPTFSNVLPTGTITSTSATISANFSDSGSGINSATAAVYLDSTKMTGCTTTATSISCAATGLASGSHTYSISVADNAGNTGTGSGSFTVSAADTTPPTVTNVLPSGTINTTSATISASYSDTGSGINSATAAVYVDGTARTGCTATATSVSCSATGLAQGAHTISVSVKDVAGNTGTGTGSFTVDSVAPAVTNVLPTGTITTTSATVSAYYSDTTSGINTASVAVTLDGTAMTGCTVSATTVSCAKTGLTNGAHTIGVSVADNAGNTGTGTGSFTVSTGGGAPTITSVTPTGTVTSDTQTITINYTLTGSVSSASSYVYLDNIPLTGCTYTNTRATCARSGLNTSAHTITGRIYDGTSQYGTIPSTSFTVSISAKRSLQSQINGTVTRSGTQVVVPIRIHNAGSATMYAPTLTSPVSNSDGAMYTQPSLPLSFGSSVSANGNTSVQQLTYNVPTTVHSFYTYLIFTARTSSSGGTTYTYYLPIQVTGI